MKASNYTLLIVESPVVAKIIQEQCPTFVYVVATEGFCWTPKYNLEKNTLKPIAVPSKADIRKEIKEQARWASDVIIAVDSDPSGDFIAWSISRFLKNKSVYRGYLQHFGSKGINKMLNETSQYDSSGEDRLKNEYLIQAVWNRSSLPLSLKDAGLVTLFKGMNKFHSFLNEDRILFKSSEPVQCNRDEWFEAALITKEPIYEKLKPLSTFDLIDNMRAFKPSLTYKMRQDLLQKLFQTTLYLSDESLISYPRTNARAFYSETWNSLKNQYYKLSSKIEFKPQFLQDVADPSFPHDSIHPLKLSLTPTEISGELTGELSNLYRLIYDHTLQTLEIPRQLERAYAGEFHPDIFFYAPNSKLSEAKQSLRPCITISDLGLQLNKLGLLSPSSFGENLDRWMSQKWISVENSVVTPGKELLSHIKNADYYYQLIGNLGRLKKRGTISPETVSSIISS
ncbi:MAG: toprim domain-containing protein [Balneolaceae bacterium]